MIEWFDRLLIGLMSGSALALLFIISKAILNINFKMNLLIKILLEKEKKDKGL